jgi:hypothetical protein
MTYETFEKLIKDLTKIQERSHQIYQLGLNLMDYEETYHNIITLLLKETFGEEGWEWVSWYLYERKGFDGKILQAWDKDNNEICHNIPSLWKTVQEYQT